MLGGTPITSVLGSGVDNTDPEALKGFIRAACGEGLALMILQPGTKVPADMRTPHKRRADDKAAREAAKEAGRLDWAQVKSAAGLELASTDPKVVLKHLDEYVKTFGREELDEYGNPSGHITLADHPVNFGIEVGRSRVIVVDCDTRAEVVAFLTDFGAPLDMPPTVATPGKVVDGEWLHKDGGHFYFTLPDGVELPTQPGAMVVGSDPEAKYAILWSQRYVVIPPSVRSEGVYELVGRDYPATEELVDAILEQADRRTARMKHEGPRDEGLANTIDSWSEQVSWSDILSPIGWTPAARPDGCGCPVWTAPGVHASPKSATAHDTGCTEGRYTQTNAPLHIWTYNPGEPFEKYIADHGTSTLSKLQAIALTEFDGSIGKAMDALNLTPQDVILTESGVDARTMGSDEGNTSNLDEDIPAPTITPDTAPPWDTTSSESADPEETPSSADAEELPVGVPLGTLPFDLPGANPTPDAVDAAPFPDEEDDPDILNSDVQGVPKIAPFAYWRHTPPPAYIVEDLIEHGGLSAIIGAPGTGKSSVALDLACHIVTGRAWQGRKTLKTRVLYLPGEGLTGAVQRLLAWEQAHGVEVGRDLLLGDSIINLAADKEAWAVLTQYVAEHKIGLVIFDTYARMSLGMEENSATDTNKGIRRFDQFREHTKTGVLVVHHTAKGNPTVGRGSSALNGALDSELLVTAGWSGDEVADLPGKAIELITSKQKNAELLVDPLRLCMVSWPENDSVIITGVTGTVDPLASDAFTYAPPTPEPTIEIAVRIRDFIDRVPTQGATRADIATGVDLDDYSRSRGDAARHWKRCVAEAVDLGLRLGLIETLSGTPSGARYIPGPTTRATARQTAAADAVTTSSIQSEEG